jgi:hypothetical protein
MWSCVVAILTSALIRVTQPLLESRHEIGLEVLFG